MHRTEELNKCVMKIKINIPVILFVLVLASINQSFSQTYPIAHSLLTGDFVFSGFTDSESTAYPTSIRGYANSDGYINEGGDYTNSSMSNKSLRANSSSLTNFTIRNEGTNGVSIFDAHNASSANLGALLLSLNTTGTSDVTVSWTGRTIYSRADRQFAIRIQYRVGTSGSFIDLGEEYQSTLSSTPASAQNFNTVLPAAADDNTIVQVRWLYIGKVTGSTLADRIALDDITVTANTSSGITLDECGTTLSVSNVDMTFTELAGAERYEVELSGGNLGASTYSNYPSAGKYNLNWPFYYQAAPLEYNQTYSVRIRPLDGSLNPIGDWGNSCDITTPTTIPTPQLDVGYCGITLTDLKEAVQSEYVPFATNYRFELSGGPIVGTVTKETGRKNPTIAFSSIADFTYGETYNIRVQAYVNGVWGDYGSTCTLTTDNTPSALQIRSNSCGITLANWTDKLYSDQLPSVEQWQFQVFRDKSGGGITIVESITKSVNYFSLSELAAYSSLYLQENKNYYIRVRGYFNGIAGAYGDVCTITTPSTAPESAGSNIELFSWQCGTTISNNTNIYSTIPDINYDGIEFRFRTSGDLTDVESIVSADNKIRLSELTLLNPNTTYSVDVRAVIQSGVLYGSYSSTCDITTEALVVMAKNNNEGGLSSRQGDGGNGSISNSSTSNSQKDNSIGDLVNQESNVIESVNSVIIYPNPFSDKINIEFASDFETIHIFDFNGRELNVQKTVLDNKLILNTSNLARGYYFIRIMDIDGIKTMKLIKE